MFWLFLIPIVLLLIGLADLPIGYYTLVRISVCLVCALSCYWSYKRDDRVGIATVSFGLLALLFNPIIPVYLQDKGVWTVVDIITVILLVIRYSTLKERKVS